jgi:S1-C subfamily serine protease
MVPKLVNMRVLFTLAKLNALLIICASLAFPLTAIAKPNIEEAIVKIYTTSSSPDYDSPWTMHGSEAFKGSGCIIGDRQILTNAHVVEDQTFIQVRRQGDPNRYQARVLHVAHDVDLALITVDDPKFFSGVQPLRLGNLPQLLQEVRVYGYPLGGDTLSITKGIISRIEDQIYVHSKKDFLAVQIDAAINPGNSGGPAIVDNRIVGITTQINKSAQNIGYIIPTPIIEHFLKDVEGGEYHGFPQLGVKLQAIENSDQREIYGMSQNQTGALVIRICPGSLAEGKLKINDVLMKVDGHAIANDASVEFRPKESTSFSYYIQEHQIGESLELGILRGGKYETLRIRLDKTARDYDLIPMEFDTLPRYYIFGGLVFTPLTINYLKTWGDYWAKEAPAELLSRLQFNCKSTEGQEVVLLLRVLADDTNQGYHDLRDLVITKVNGEKIINLRDLIRVVEASPNEKYMVFEEANGKQIVLNKKRAVEGNKKILATYHISQESFPGLKEEAPP